jgi:multicomponent Na+:H+ antiporter subunit E
MVQDMRAVLRQGVLIVAVWVLLWDRFSLANLLSGAAVAALLLVLFPSSRRETSGHAAIRPLAVLRLGLYLVRTLVAANLTVAREALRPRPHTHTGVVAVPVPSSSEGILTFIANVTALSPGTMTVAVDLDPPTIYLHILDLHDVDQVRASIATLEDLTVRAFGSRTAIDGLGRA